MPVVKQSFRQRFFRYLAGTGIKADPEISSQDSVDYGGFRYDQSFTVSDIDVIIHRDDVLHFMVYGIVKQAFSEGADIRQSDEEDAEVVEWSKDFFKAFDMERACSFERAYGVVDIIHMKDETKKTKEGENERWIQIFREPNIELKITPAGKIDYLIYTIKVGGNHPDLTQELKGRDFEEFHQHFVLRPTDIEYRGRSIVEPIWNIVNGRRLTLQSASIYTFRVASGLKTVTIYDPGGEGRDKLKEGYELGLKRLESSDTSMIMWSGIDQESGQKWSDEFKIDQGTGSFNFDEKMDIYHKALAGQTSIPKNYWDGQFAGTLGAERVIELLYGSYRKIQNDWSDLILEVAKVYAKIRGLEWNDDYVISWNLKAKLSEMEEAAIKLSTTQRVVTAYQNKLMTYEEARIALNLDPNVKVPLPEMQVKLLKTGQDQDQETEEEEKGAAEQETGKQEPAVA